MTPTLRASLPISQLTNKRIERPEEIVSEDDTIKGVVIKVENRRGSQERHPFHQET